MAFIHVRRTQIAPPASTKDLIQLRVRESHFVLKNDVCVGRQEQFLCNDASKISSMETRVQACCFRRTIGLPIPRGTPRLCYTFVTTSKQLNCPRYSLAVATSQLLGKA